MFGNNTDTNCDQILLSSLVINTELDLLCCGSLSVLMEQWILLFLMVDKVPRITKKCLKAICFQLEIKIEKNNWKIQQDKTSVPISHSTIAWFTQNQVSVMNWPQRGSESDGKSMGNNVRDIHSHQFMPVRALKQRSVNSGSKYASQNLKGNSEEWLQNFNSNAQNSKCSD